MTETVDVLIIGAGAAGLMCAIRAGQRGRRVLVVDHANKVGKKILMSGGGRCNFTNMYSGPENFLSANPHFCKSALSRYTPWEFIALVEKHNIDYHEKKLGQLFCDQSSKQIVGMLLHECERAGVEVRTHTAVELEQLGSPHRLRLADGNGLRCESLVIATGGYSIPRMGATGFGFDLAQALGMKLQPTRAALVPVTLDAAELARCEALAGVALDSQTSAHGTGFRENILFTHKGLSGPAVLQASSYWQPGEPLAIDLFPDQDLHAWLQQAALERPKRSLKNQIAECMPKRAAEWLVPDDLADKPLGAMSAVDRQRLVDRAQPWQVWPNGTEGYRTAEVTIGGVDTDQLSSKTMQANDHPGLYFIGEVVDVTGHLGGHNFQWAWASGQAAGGEV
jgi:hypothetical protein